MSIFICDRKSSKAAGILLENAGEHLVCVKENDRNGACKSSRTKLGIIWFKSQLRCEKIRWL